MTSLRLFFVLLWSALFNGSLSDPVGTASECVGDTKPVGGHGFAACRCKDDFIADGKSTCKRSDCTSDSCQYYESCSEAPLSCLKRTECTPCTSSTNGGQCVNTNGSYKCGCADGFVGPGTGDKGCIKEMECVVQGNKNMFSIVVPGKHVQPTDLNSRVLYKSAESDPEPSNQCDFASKADVSYIMKANWNSILKIHEDAVSTVGLSRSPTDHDFTRIHIDINECAFLDTTDTTKASFKAQLQLGYISWMRSAIYNLQCDFVKETEAEQVAVDSRLSNDLVDEQKVTAKLRLTDGSSEITSAVELGQTLYLEAGIEGDLNVETAFKSCKICKTPACNDGNEIEVIQDANANCLHNDIRRSNRFALTLSNDNEKFAKFQFPAFKYKDSAGIPQDLLLQCELIICDRVANSRCRETCKLTRRRRSASQTETNQASASVALQIIEPSTQRCRSPNTAQGSSRFACTNGTFLGSLCRVDCFPGFEARVKGQKSVIQVCEEQVTESFGPFYFGTKLTWTPNFAGCVDADECLENPCPHGTVCKNTIGSFQCVKTK